MYTLYMYYYILLAGHCITHYILHHSRHSPALHDIVPTLDQAMQSRSQASDTVQQTSWAEPRVIMALPFPTPGGKVKYWWWLYFWLMGWWPWGPAPVPGRTWVLCLHFITGLSYNKPTESFSSQRSARINCSSFNSRIAHGLSAIIALFRWLFQAFIYFTLGGITALSLFRFGPGFPSLVIPYCTHGEDQDCSRHFMTSLYCCIFGL